MSIHTRPASFLPLLTALCLSAGLSAGCFAHAPAEPDENPAPPESPSDGLPDSRMAFLGVTPEQWEAQARRECEQDPAGNGCSKLFERAADRLRWQIGSEDAPGLLVHACSQGHRLSCAAVDLLKGATLDHVEELARLACRRRLRSNECYGAASLFAHSCNQKRQAASCLALADFFSLVAPQRPHWASHYQTLACAYGGFCGSEEEEAPAASEPDGPPSGVEGGSRSRRPTMKGFQGSSASMWPSRAGPYSSLSTASP